MAERNPTSRSREGPGTRWIVDEREGPPGLPPAWFLFAVFSLGIAVSALVIVIGLQRGPSTHAERTFLDAGGVWSGAVYVLGMVPVRIIMGVLAGATVVGTGFVGRRFTHSPAIGILAAILVALDPALWVDGQLAIPATVVRFAIVSSLALAVGGHPVYHWLVPIPLIVGALVDPGFLLWGIGIALVLLFRGHIFAAPKHLRDAFLQGVGIPLLIAVPALFIVRATIGQEAVQCGQTFGRSILLLDIPLYAPGVVALTNPVVSIGGLAVLAALTVGAIFQVFGTFRVARLPGRIQIRLPARLGRTASRALWLALFALLMPVPEAAIVLGAVAIALGVQALTEDSPAFGLTIAVVVILFAAVVVARVLAVIGGSASPGGLEAALQWMPWVNDMTCRPIL